MINMPTRPVRITSGALAGRSFIATSNGDVMHIKDRDGMRSSITIPRVTKCTFAPGDKALPSKDDPTIISAPTE